MMSPLPKNLEQAFQEVTHKIYLSSLYWHDSMCTHPLFYLISLILASYVSPFLSCTRGHCFLPTFLSTFLLFWFLHTFMLCICLSKTFSILYCGLWRIWSQAVGKVSVRCAMTQAWLSNFLFTWFASFLLTPTLFILVKKVNICVTPLVLYFQMMLRLGGYVFGILKSRHIRRIVWTLPVRGKKLFCVCVCCHKAA